MSTHALTLLHPDAAPRGPRRGDRKEAYVDRAVADLSRGVAPSELVEAEDPATVRAIRRSILAKANRLVHIVLDTLDPPVVNDENGKPVTQVTMAPEKKAQIALKLLALGLVGTDLGDAGLMGKGSRTLRTLQATPEEIAQYVQEGLERKAHPTGGADGTT